MEGLKFKLKSEGSLTRKISDDAKMNNISINVAADRVNDALRYTTILDSKSFGRNVLKSLDELEAAGFTKIAVKNTFVEGEVYKGVNTIFRTKSGQTFEVQFHTQRSFNVKQNVNHTLFEEARLASTSTSRKKELTEVMRRNSEIIPSAQGASLIENFSLKR